MQRKRQPDRNDEPEVTFELEETPRSRRGGYAEAAGAAAIAGAGLVSSAAASESGDSLDVFDQPDDADMQSGDVPVTSFQTLLETEAEPEFPPIDFAATDDAAAHEDIGGGEEVFGATADVGGGFVLDDTPSDDAFGVTDIDIEAVSGPLEPLTEHDPLDELHEHDPDHDLDQHDLDDLDLS